MIWLLGLTCNEERTSIFESIARVCCRIRMNGSRVNKDLVLESWNCQNLIHNGHQRSVVASLAFNQHRTRCRTDRADEPI